jgi:hypothetical protein
MPFKWPQVPFDIRTEFYEDWFGHSKVNVEGNATHKYTDTDLIKVKKAKLSP